MFVLGLQGSPRAKGNTGILLSAFLNEVERLGGRVNTLDATQMKVMPCLGCGACERKGYCPQDDDMQAAYPLLRKADLVVLATPIYFYGPTAQLKAFIDRSQALWSRKYALGLEDPRRKWRKGFLLAVGATKGKNLFDGTNLTAKYFFDAVGAGFEGKLGYRKVEKMGDMGAHPTALAEASAKAKELSVSFLNRKKVLFVCRENACRSQMAAAFARQMAGDRFEVESAGNAPAEKVNPMMETVMAEKGIDMAYLKPSAISDLPDAWQPDAVVFMGCEVTCPTFPGAVTEDWDLPDPAKESIDFMRNVRDQVEKRVGGFVLKLG
ncbi:MAG: flavin reductase [Deltaproteobacteria bacterium]|jgi:arsenate reductase (thioredoxin)|nr:flavin reductase [Deltaproteobacteria bacterium]